VEYCPVCQDLVQKQVWEKHLRWASHKRKEAFIKYRSVLEEAEKDKHGATVEGATDLGFLDPSSMTQRWGGRTGVLAVKSPNPAMTTVLVKVELASSQGSNRVQSGYV
jgi:helicase MOV-10